MEKHYDWKAITEDRSTQPWQIKQPDEICFIEIECDIVDRYLPMGTRGYCEVGVFKKIGNGLPEDLLIVKLRGGYWSCLHCMTHDYSLVEEIKNKTIWRTSELRAKGFKVFGQIRRGYRDIGGVHYSDTIDGKRLESNRTGKMDLVYADKDTKVFERGEQQ